MWHRRIFQILQRCCLCYNKFRDGLVSWVLALFHFCMSVVFASLWHHTDIILAFPTQTFPFARFTISKHYVPQSSFIKHRRHICLPHWPECLLIFSPLPKEWIVQPHSMKKYIVAFWSLVFFICEWLKKTVLLFQVTSMWYEYDWRFFGNLNFNIKQWKKFAHKKALCLSAGTYGNNPTNWQTYRHQ